MSPIEAVLMGAAVLALAIAIVASIRLARERESFGRFAAQLAIVWFVPFLGPLIAIQLLRKEPERGPNPLEVGPTDFESGDRINQHDANS
jgi:hypothetical protein